MHPSLLLTEYPWSKPPEFSWLGELSEISPHGGLGTIHTKHRSEAPHLLAAVWLKSPPLTNPKTCVFSKGILMG